MKKPKFIKVLIPILTCGLFIAPFVKNDFKSTAADGHISYGDRFFTGNNCTVDTYLDKSLQRLDSNMGHATGFTTEIIPDKDCDDVRVTLNATVVGSGLTSKSANAENMFVFEKYFDDSGSPMAVADMIVITFKSIKDPTKSLSIVNHWHYGTWNGVTVSFTDQLEYRENTAYIKGTDAPTTGWDSTNAKYNFAGHIVGGSCSEAPLFGGDYFYTQILSDGTVQHNQYSIYANILDEEFLEATRSKLPEDSPYYDMYTTEYAQSILDALAARDSSTGQGVCTMSVTYYGIKTSQPLAFRMRAVNNVFLGDNVTDKKPTMTQPFSLQKLDKDFNPIKLYKDLPYTPSDVLDNFSLYRLDDGSNPIDITGNTDVVDRSDATWFNGTTYYTKTFTATEEGERKKGLYVVTRCSPSGQSWSNRYSVQEIFFDVEIGEPTISGEETIGLLEGVEYDLSIFFTYNVVGDREQASVKFYIDGVEHSKIYTADNLNHTIRAVVTDSRGYTAETTSTTISGSISVPEVVNYTAQPGETVFLPVPSMNYEYVYTVELYNSSNELLSNDICYEFVSDGAYKVVYKFEITESSIISKSLILNITLDYKIPTITLLGSYKEQYYLGETVQFVDAVATDGLNDLEVRRKLFINEQPHDISGENMQVTVAGAYKVTYEVTYGDNRIKSMTINFEVVRDNVAPSLIVNGTYAEEYTRGSIIQILNATAHENSGLVPTLNIELYINNTKTEIASNTLILEQSGTYLIRYIATNFSGVSAVKEFMFTVPAPAKQGCGGNVVTTNILISSIALVGVVAILVKGGKKDEK